MPRLSKVGAAALAAFGWTSGTSAVTASYLVVAGGGGGGTDRAGGGGAGGLLTGTASLDATLSYTITVGAGGVGATTVGSYGGNGNNSIFNTATSIGGGAGGTNGAATGRNGGSGGGARGGAGSSTAGGVGTVGQGNAGGTGDNDNAGGGGGAGAVGGNGTGGVSGNGGVGIASSLSGTSTYYAGGGGGGVPSGTVGSGGLGGGGSGSSNSAPGGSGTTSTGGGGGGGGSGGSFGGAGGSGIVIISYAGAQQFSGGIVTSVGGNTIHTFTTSGTLGPITTLSASYLIVAGGGGGASLGGGGAGGLLSGSGVTIDPNSTYLVTVGAGGTGTGSPTIGGNGGSSTFSMVTTTAVGGGGGGSFSNSGGNNAASGGSGGGGGGADAGQSVGSGGAGTSGQGNSGASGTSQNTTSTGGGGGGAGAAGAVGTNGSYGGQGGVGTSSSISGTATFYAGGGSGGGSLSRSGGNGGGGAGGASNQGGTAGTANTGGGGGGGGNTSAQTGGTGGSGVVIISYAGATQQMAGGTVTIVGGNVIHTFTSTGYLAPIDFSTGSLRFRASNSAYLTRTPTVASNQKTWTWSGWVKRGTLGTNQVFFNAGNNGFVVRLNETTNYLEVYNFSGGYQLQIITSQVFRDPAAWYHIVVVLDTTQATSSNRAKVYVNGSQVTSFGTATYPSQNADLLVNGVNTHAIGILNSIGQYFDGELTEVNFIDGQALTPNSFGTFNSYGVWQPITYGGSYGTNGFYLPFNRQAVSYVGSFSGSTQYLTTTLPATLSGQFTIETYIYRNTSATSVMFTFGDSILSTGLEMYIGSSGTLFQIYSNNAAQISSSSPIPKVGGWSHVALTRDSSNVVRLFLNGVQVGGTWTTTAAFSSTLRIGAEFYNGAFNPGYWDGYMSNFRVVTGTALYTSNFIPSTSALTAVSGTQLLTLQNSSIVDNSTNALSITNTNGVSTGQTYPFAYGIFNDQGPAGNNWTPSGISGAFGTTLDYLGDAPTLTSATVANYCTINPLDGVGTATISDGNLKFTNTGANAVFRGTMGMAGGSGKWYFEITQQTVVGSVAPIVYGIATLQSTPSHSAAVIQRAALYYTDLSGKYLLVYFNGVQVAFFSVATAIAINEVLQIAYDSDTGKFWIGKGGVWSDSSGGTTGNPATGANPTYTFSSVDQPMTPTFDHAGVSYTASLNCGQQPFQNTPPSGFVALNAYNL